MHRKFWTALNFYSRLTCGLAIATLLTWSTGMFFYSMYARESADGYPTVRFNPTPALDQLLCPPGYRQFIGDQYLFDRTGKLNEFKRYWNLDAPELLNKAIELTGGRFAQEVQNVYVHRCQQIFSFSNPTIIVGTALYMNEIDGSKIDGKQLTEEILFHELLHPFVIKALFPKMLTTLIRKYSGESITTLFHLHLFALQKSVLVSLGRSDQWETLKKLHETISPGVFKRALQIVDAEGEDAFVRELRCGNGKFSKTDLCQ